MAAPNAEPDDVLLARVRDGDDRAVAILLERHAPAIFRFGMKMCGEREDAEDIVQETLLAAARGLRDVRGSAALTTWLYTVARSFCIKKRRKKKDAPSAFVPLGEESGDLAASGALPDESTAARQLGEALDAAIHELDEGQREVLVLRDVEGLSAPEVAEVLGISVEAVKSRLHRARSELRTRLAPIVGGEAMPATAPCRDVVTTFSKYLEGDIGPKACDEMQQHVASCKRCTAACESLKKTLSLCRTSASGTLPPELQARVRRAIAEIVR